MGDTTIELRQTLGYDGLWVRGGPTSAKPAGRLLRGMD